MQSIVKEWLAALLATQVETVEQVLQLRKSFDRLLNAVWQEAALGLFEVTGPKVRYELQLQWTKAGLAWFPGRPNRVRLPRASSDCGPLDSSSHIYWNEFWKEPVPSNCVFVSICVQG
jgi:hypothetical protein